MITGKLKDLPRYKGLSKEIDEAIEYVEKTCLYSLAVGKYVISDRVTVNRQQYIGKEEADAENHENFLDLQIVVKGKEGFGYADISNPTLKVKKQYNPEKDVTKYDVEDESMFIMSDGSFALVFNEDIHRPGLKVNDELIEKVVVKIRVK